MSRQTIDVSSIDEMNKSQERQMVQCPFILESDIDTQQSEETGQSAKIVQECRHFNVAYFSIWTTEIRNLAKIASFAAER